MFKESQKPNDWRGGVLPAEALCLRTEALPSDLPSIRFTELGEDLEYPVATVSREAGKWIEKLNSNKQTNKQTLRT